MRTTPLRLVNSENIRQKNLLDFSQKKKLLIKNEFYGHSSSIEK